MKKAKYRQLVDKYKKEIESLREDILALIGDDCMLKYQTHKRWEVILSTGDSMMVGSRSISEQGQGILDKITTNPVLANEHTPIDVNFGGKHAPIVGFGGTRVVFRDDFTRNISLINNEDYVKFTRDIFCTGIDHAAYFILNGYTFSQKKGCLLKCVDNKTGQTFEGAEAEKMLFIAKGNQLVSDTNTIKGQFDYLKVFDDYLEELVQSVETLGHA